MLEALRRFFGSAPSDDGPVKVILGLGNPGKEYEQTRHNVGWWALDHLADVWRFPAWKKDGQALVSSGTVGSARVRLVKPLTFMNLSGAVLATYKRRAFWSAATDLLVIVDEVALPVGSMRLRASGSAGGHNGLKSIEGQLGSRDYARLRIGVEPPHEWRGKKSLSDLVLGPFGKGERADIEALLPKVAGACELWLEKGITAAMNHYNKKQTPGNSED